LIQALRKIVDISNPLLEKFNAVDDAVLPGEFVDTLIEAARQKAAGALPAAKELQRVVQDDKENPKRVRRPGKRSAKKISGGG
jgi:hypothetical protein